MRYAGEEIQFDTKLGNIEVSMHLEVQVKCDEHHHTQGGLELDLCALDPYEIEGIAQMTWDSEYRRYVVGQDVTEEFNKLFELYPNVKEDIMEAITEVVNNNIKNYA